MMTPPPPIRFGARVSAALSAVVTLILIGTVSYHALEPWDWIQSFYFTVATLTTVGYGDLHPSNDPSRLFTSIFILVGVAVALTALTTIGTAYMDRRTQRVTERAIERNDPKTTT